MSKKCLKIALTLGVGIAVALSIYYPYKMYTVQKDINKGLENTLYKTKMIQKEEYQRHNEETKVLLKKIDGQSKSIKELTSSVKELKAKNSELEGVRLSILNSTGYIPSADEVNLLERLVECEAGAEPFEGKIAVANVIQNRIKSKEFPNNIHDIIYQGIQFEPVVTGMINNRKASKESKEAVRRALKGERAINSDIVNFWADYLPKSNDLWNHIEVEKIIGTQCFGKAWRN